jgi:transcriptional regulator with XRE-family HTH domain
MSIDPFEIGREIKRHRENTRIDGRPMSQAQLGEISGVGQSTVGRLEKGDFNPNRPPGSIYQIAAALQKTIADFGFPAEPGVPPQRKPGAGGIVSGDRLIGEVRDWPVHASAEGGAGEIIIDTQPVSHDLRPTVVAGVRGAYGLIITGSSMIPQFEPGDIAIVNPHLPVTPGGTYIFYAEKEGQARATIKRLRRATTDSWLVTQHNPAEGQKPDFTLSRREWTVVHRVLGNHYGR